MRCLLPIGLALVVVSQLGAGPGTVACDPAGNVRFVWDQSGPEDLVAVPRSPWVLASGYPEGTGRIDPSGRTGRLREPDHDVERRTGRSLHLVARGDRPVRRRRNLRHRHRRAVGGRRDLVRALRGDRIARFRLASGQVR